MAFDELGYFVNWLKAFGLTALVEVPLVVMLFAREEPSVWRRVGLGFFAQLASHPLVWFLFALLPIEPWALRIAIAEVWAFGSEVVFYMLVFRASVGRAALVSGAANLASFGLGLAVGDWLFT